MISLDQSPAAAELLASVGLGREFQCARLEGGANNRVFRVDTPHGRAVLKSYFRHQHETHDRLGAEYAFASFAWQRGVRSLARPLGCDRDQRLALYEFVEGRRLRPGEVGPAEIDAAIEFFRALNRHKSSAAHLPVAAEACFTLADHLACVDRRLARLEHIEPATELHRDASRFVEHELLTAWDEVRTEVERGAGRLGLPLSAELAPAERCVSPSDFGFHNALRTADGRLRFLDFEYAGWDDPAKLVCDFFCQPAVPAPLDAFDRFAAAVAAETSRPAWHAERFRLLLPVYRAKWCCILLNDFLPIDAQRRRFALADDERDARHATQLQKARTALAVLQAAP